MSAPKTVIIIPARYASSRLPGKPLQKISGIPMIERVWAIASAVKDISDVFIATDDQRIIDAVSTFGGHSILTSEKCKNGTERALEAAESLSEKPDIIINLQGDAPLTPPWVIQELVSHMRSNPETQIATPAVKLTEAVYNKLRLSKESGEVSGSTVVFDSDKNALYVSKSIVPFIRTKGSDPYVFRHIGLYAYRYEALKSFLSLPKSLLEEAEQIEVLRAIENKIPVKVVIVDYKGRTHWGVDSMEDVLRAEEIIKNEGELILRNAA